MKSSIFVPIAFALLVGPGCVVHHYGPHDQQPTEGQRQNTGTVNGTVQNTQGGNATGGTATTTGGTSTATTSSDSTSTATVRPSSGPVAAGATVQTATPDPNQGRTQLPDRNRRVNQPDIGVVRNGGTTAGSTTTRTIEQPKVDARTADPVQRRTAQTQRVNPKRVNTGGPVAVGTPNTTARTERVVKPGRVGTAQPQLSAKTASFDATAQQPDIKRGGSIEADIVHRILKRNEAHIEHCAQQHAANKVGDLARLNLYFELSGTGQVHNPKASNDRLGSAMNRCVETKAKRWRFQRPNGGKVGVEVLYKIEPK